VTKSCAWDKDAETASMAVAQSARMLWRRMGDRSFMDVRKFGFGELETCGGKICLKAVANFSLGMPSDNRHVSQSFELGCLVIGPETFFF
jgi:hypothetical protein